MSRRAIALVVHGAHWLDAQRAAHLRDQLARVASAAVDVVVARDEPSRPRRAAACLTAALHQTEADLIVVADSISACQDEWLRALLAGVDDQGLALAWLASSPRLPQLPTSATDLIASLAPHTRDSPSADADPAFWAIRRDGWRAVGSLDARCWSIGAVADLADRLDVLGYRTGAIVVPGAPDVSESYPLEPEVRTLLQWRSPLLRLVRSAPDATLGPSLARAGAALLAAAWAGTGLDAATVTFGGAWGRASLLERWRTRLGGRPPADLWPHDEVATAAPLAALVSFARELPGLVEERRSLGLGQPPAALMAAARHVGPPASVDIRVRPRVSVIVVSWNGREHLEPCFSSLLASDYPADLLELICVDNGSTDGSVEWLAQHVPAVRVVALPDNRGFTGGNVAGVAASTGDVLVFLNNDMRVEPTLVSRLVDGLGGTAACAGARVMSWDGQRIDFVRGTASFEARGFQEHYQERYHEGMRPADSFFPNGGAFALTRTAYDEAGGFDPHLFAYYDDLDLGWRLRTVGYTIRTVADAVAQHRHGATSRTQPGSHKRWLMERNALWVAMRTYDDTALPQVLPALLLLAGLRVAQDLTWLRTPIGRRLRAWTSPSRRSAEAPRDVYRAGNTRDQRTAPARVIASLPMPELAAIGHVLTHLPALAEARRECQRRRRVPDADVLPHLGRPLEALDGRTSYRQAHHALADLLHIRRVVGQRQHVLLVTHEALRQNMSGPAVRVLEMGRALSRTARVTIAAPGPVEMADDRLSIVPFDPASPAALRAQADSADVVVVQGFALHSYPFLTRLVAPIVVDLYCPFTLEYLEQTRSGTGQVDADTAREATAILGVQNAQLQYGDLFLSASERQRDFWIGALHTAGRVNAHTLARDPGLEQLVTVVPFGLPDEPVAHADARAQARRRAEGRPAGVLKGVHPAIRATDKVLLWGGSLLDWQDPETLIDAVARLTATRDDVRLFFMGVKHPNPQVKPMAIVERSRERARAAGLLDTHVIFNDWVPYDERATYLREADLGVSTHRRHLETRYSFRTRMLDYLWAGLPIVCTEGDYFGDLVRARGLGRAVRPNDPVALADAIAELLDDEQARQRSRTAVADVARDMTWDAVTAPLRAFCAAPTFAADRAPHVARLHETLADSYKGTRAVKRWLLRAGVGEGTIESVKRWPATQTAMAWRNHLALWRARRRAGTR